MCMRKNSCKSVLTIRSMNNNVLTMIEYFEVLFLFHVEKLYGIVSYLHRWHIPRTDLVHFCK